MESEEESEEESEDGTKGAEGSDSDEDGEEGDEETTGEGDIEVPKSQNLNGGELGEEGGQSGDVEPTANESVTDKNFRNNEDKLHQEMDEWDREPSTWSSILKNTK